VIVIDGSLSLIMPSRGGEARTTTVFAGADKIFLFAAYAATAMLLFRFARLPEGTALQR
jgi:hypothetical protein